jgi:hypothetical protein
MSTLQLKSTESLLAASTKLADPDALSKIRPDLPMYLFSGSEAPVGQIARRSHPYQALPQSRLVQYLPRFLRRRAARNAQ